jgi:hypothetical protein
MAFPIRVRQKELKGDRQQHADHERGKEHRG